jgi:DNA polymerase-3 subunit epsilon
MRQVVLDTETTGLDVGSGHRMIEIGCVELVNRKFTGRRYHQYLNPGRDIEEEALAVHGITRSFLEDKPFFEMIADELITFIEGAELIIHNAPFDVGFINNELKLAKKNWGTLTDYCSITDSLMLARQLHMGQRNSLDALCKRYGIDNSQRELHGALLDAHLLAQVYLAMTGGQGSLFGDAAFQEISKETVGVQVTFKQMQKKLKVVKASSEELALHEEQCGKMLQKGKCLFSPVKNTE